MSDVREETRFEALASDDDVLDRLQQVVDDIERLQIGYDGMGEGVEDELQKAVSNIERGIQLRERVIAFQALSEADELEE